MLQPVAKVLVDEIERKLTWRGREQDTTRLPLEPALRLVTL
jgi:hypothetical protein